MKLNEQILYPLDEIQTKDIKYRVITARYSGPKKEDWDIIYLAEKITEDNKDESDVVTGIIDPYDESKFTLLRQKELLQDGYEIIKDSTFILDYLKKSHCENRCITKDCSECILPGSKDKSVRFIPTLGDMVYTEKAGNIYKLIQETLEDILYQNVDDERDRIWFTNMNVPADTPHKDDKTLAETLGVAGRVKRLICGTCLSECSECPFSGKTE